VPPPMLLSAISLWERVDRLVQATVAPDAWSYISARAADILLPYSLQGPIVDVGCGFASPLNEEFHTVGVDINLSRALAHTRFGSAIAADAAALPFSDGQFVAAFSSGLLHHLDDAAARRAIGEMIRVVRRGGAVIIFDGVVPSSVWVHPFAWLIRKFDFGHHMRTEREVSELLGGVPPWTCDRVKYAWTGLEGVWCVHHRTA
jgi:SAM-dependent methyltransferase